MKKGAKTVRERDNRMTHHQPSENVFRNSRCERQLLLISVSHTISTALSSFLLRAIWSGI